MKTTTTTALLALALLAGRAPAAPTTQPAAPSSTPATQPSQDVAALIRQLGADDYHDRREASLKIKKMGKAAIPALKEARLSKDPEIQARADELLQEIDEPTVVEEAVPQPTGAPGAHQMSMSFTNGSKVTDIQETGRSIHIEQSPANGIKMVVTGQIEGKQVTREYKAPNAEKLQKRNPQAFALYQQYGGGGAMGVGRIQFQAANGIGVNNINIRVNAVAGGVNVAPDPKGKLGITAGESKDGVTALRIIPDSRAEKIGMKENDVIQKINGKQVHNVDELQKTMAENPKDLVVEALREGKPVTLTEGKKAQDVEDKAEKKKE